MKHMKYNLLFTITLGLLLLSWTPVNAGLITGGAAGGGTGGALSGGVTVVTGSQGAGNHDGIGDGGTFATNPNQVSFTLNVFQLNTPFFVDFTIGDGVITNNDLTEYAFAVTVNNMLTDGKEINGFDINLTSARAFPALVGFDKDTPVPVATGGTFPLAFETPNLTGSNLRFGGLSGGGGGIPIGTSQVLNFSVALADFGTIGMQSFTLQFTANPEPEAIFLGCFTLAIGGFFVYRRRKQQLELQTETATESV